MQPLVLSCCLDSVELPTDFPTGVYFAAATGRMPHPAQGDWLERPRDDVCSEAPAIVLGLSWLCVRATPARTFTP